ncbi:MAG: hypothetical protein M1828_003438 [Chrysothrix sp. TS-e1954]|nr:MAG: hypothetical protein M1828_003438 [Chrysothrix sp. TS-e1954]
MDSFDDATKVFINDIHRAWKSQASLSEYAILRDKVIAHQDRLDVQITTLSTVVRLVARKTPDCEERGNLDWQDFFALAATLPSEKDGDGEKPSSSKAGRKRPPNWNAICRSRNLAIVVALWSAEIVQYYKWDSVGQGQMRIIRKCAVHFPDFEAAFVPRLNQTLLARHCNAILQCRERTLNEAGLQPLKDFDTDVLASATIDWNLQILWQTSQDGAIPLDSGGTLLRDIRPQHFRMYLLQKDRYGILEPRRYPDSYLANDIGPLTIATDSFTSEDFVDVVESSSSQSVISSCETSISSVGSAGPTGLAPSLDPWINPYSTESCQLERTTLTEQISMPPMFENVSLDTDPTLLPDLDRSPLDLGAGWRPQTAPNIGCASPPSNVFRGSCADADSFWTHASTPYASNLFAPTESRRKRPRPSIHEDSMLIEDDSNARTQVNDADVDDPLTEALRPLAPMSSGPADRSLKLMLSSAPSEKVKRLTIEERLCERHLSNLTKYTQMLTNETNSHQYWIQKQWLTAETQWANIWTSSEVLGSGRASCEEEADVLYYTAADIVAHAKAGKVFCKPIVVKERFTDSGMHTVAQFMALLRDSSTQSQLDTQALSNVQSGLTREDELAPDTWSTSDTGSSLVTSHFRNTTKSHRPLFTMLPRFRLLETLTEGHRRDAQKRTETSLFSLRACTASNTVKLSGAFLGAHAHTLYGTWTRNLEGTSYILIVPEKEMISEWESFASAGDKWLPLGRERLIVLEEDDVLLIPPGSRIVHAIHSPGDCLTEEGILWDSFTILETLRSVVWACENQTIAHELSSTDLSGIVQRLQQLVVAQPEKFQGNLDNASLLKMFRIARKALLRLSRLQT